MVWGACGELRGQIEAALVLSWLRFSVGLVGLTPSCRDVVQSLHFTHTLGNMSNDRP